MIQRPHRDFLRVLSADVGPQSVLEVGVRDGDSLCAILTGSGVVHRLALCDTWGATHGGTDRRSHAHIEQMLAARGYGGEVQWLDGPSGELLPTILPPWFDLVHIDGDHSTEGALRDLRLAWPLCAKVLVVHDIFMGQVWTAVSTFLSEQRATIATVQMSAEDSGTLAMWRRR